MRNPRVTSHTNAVSHLSIPGILNIWHCASFLLFLIEARNSVGFMGLSTSQYMLLSIGNYVTVLVFTIIRITAARSSASLLNTLKYLQSWDSDRKKKPRKASILVVAMLFLCTAYAVYACVELVQQFEPGETRGLLGHYPILRLAVSLSKTLTVKTGIPFALSYVVVIGRELVHVYQCLCVSSKNLASWQDQETRKRKLCFKLLKRFLREFETSAKWYSVCVVASSAMACLEVLALVTTANGPVWYSYVNYGCINVFSFLFLTYAGNWVKIEASQVFCATWHSSEHCVGSLFQ